jgi:hypothetical protein
MEQEIIPCTKSYGTNHDYERRKKNLAYAEQIMTVMGTKNWVA